MCDRERERERERERDESVKTSKEIVKSLGNVYEGKEREREKFHQGPKFK